MEQEPKPEQTQQEGEKYFYPPANPRTPGRPVPAPNPPTRPLKPTKPRKPKAAGSGKSK